MALPKSVVLSSVLDEANLPFLRGGPTDEADEDAADSPAAGFVTPCFSFKIFSAFVNKGFQLSSAFHQ